MRTLFLQLVALMLVSIQSVHSLERVTEPMPLYPHHGAVTSTNPPIITWPLIYQAPFIVELEHPNSEVIRFESNRNWLVFDHIFPIGEYRWRLIPTNQTDNAPWYNFHITKNSQHYPIPNTSHLIKHAKLKNRPRSIDKQGLTQKAGTPEINQLLEKVKTWRKQSLPKEPNFKLGTSLSTTESSNLRKLIFAEEEKVLKSAIAWLATSSRHALLETKRRALNLAQMNPTGVTSFLTQDQAGRSIAWTLALVFDWLYPEWEHKERKKLLGAISPRLNDMLGTSRYGLDNSLTMDANPYNAHGVTALSKTTVICTLLAGESPFYDQCFEDVVPRYLAWPIPWGFNDGGFANGTAYAHWSLLYDQFLSWQLLNNSLGIDLTLHPWAKGYGDYITYFLPPATPTGLFGDEAESDYPIVWATQARTFNALIPSPLSAWYAKQHFREDKTHPALLLSPIADLSNVTGHLPKKTPHAIHIPSIGWVAMHSDLADRRRTSIYFKSSPYGSYNHSHADQNSFVIHSEGKVLAVDSGYYDYYGSPHWEQWYKQTKAHNAITYDGGKGQPRYDMQAKGKVVHFEHTEAFDIVTGDATKAYDDQLTSAIRSMIYIRPNTLIIYDTLESKTPRTWEWNFHALSSIQEKEKNQVEIDNDGRKLCIKPIEPASLKFSQTNQFPVAPKNKYNAQWHGKFENPQKSVTATFITLLSIGCKNARLEIQKEPEGYKLNINDYTFSLTQDGKILAD